jgi:hypothetical protein
MTLTCSGGCDDLDHVGGVEPTPRAQVGELVEHHEAVVAGTDELSGPSPPVGGVPLVVLEVVGVPREAVAERIPVDTELSTDLLLADLPVAALDELHDRHPPVARQRPQHDPNAAELLPLPLPVLTSTSEGAERKPSGRGSSVSGSPVSGSPGDWFGRGVAAHEISEHTCRRVRCRLVVGISEVR